MSLDRSNPNNDSNFSNRSGSGRKSTNFNTHDYILIFEHVMNDKECKELFHEYLKQKAKSGELLDFLNDYRDFVAYYFSLNLRAKPSCLVRDVWKREVSDITPPPEIGESEEQLRIRKTKKVSDFHAMANNLMENYIIEGSRHEINIGFCRKDIVQRWSNINTAMKSETMMNTVQGLTQIIDLLNPETLFRNSSNLVRVDLEYDQFPRFVRSDMVQQFLKKKGEGFTRSVALNISQGYKLDIRFKPQELVSKKIDDKMIYFGFTLLQDTPDWNCVYDKNDSQVFMSKTNYTFGLNSADLKLKKMSFTIPYSLDDFWALYVDTENYEKHKIFETSNYKFRQYIEPNSGKIDQSTGELLDNQLAMAQVQSSLRLVPFTKPRQYSVITTIIYEPILDCIIQVSPTFRDPNVGNESVLVIGLSYTYFFRLRDGSTRVILVTYADMNMNVPNFVENRALAFKVNSFKKGIVKALDMITEKRKKPATFKDDPQRPWNIIMEVNRNMFPNRSWYKEWKESTLNDNVE